MGLADAFGKDDRIELKVTSFIDMVERTTKAEALAGLMMNGIKCDVPHIFLREVMTGEKEEIEHPFADMLLDMLAGEEEPEEDPEEEEPNEEPAPIPATHSKPIAESLIKNMEPVEVHKEDNKPAKASIKKKPKGDIEKIQRLAEDGKTAKEIAELVGCSLPTARKYMKEVISPDEEAEETEAPTV